MCAHGLWFTRAIGAALSTPRELGIDPRELDKEIQRMSGVQNSPELPTRISSWPLHLKHTTLLDADQLLQMDTAHTNAKTFLRRALRYLLDPSFYDGLRTSRTIKNCRITTDEL